MYDQQSVYQSPTAHESDEEHPEKAKTKPDTCNPFETHPSAVQAWCVELLTSTGTFASTSNTRAEVLKNEVAVAFYDPLLNGTLGLLQAGFSEVVVLMDTRFLAELQPNSGGVLLRNNKQTFLAAKARLIKVIVDSVPEGFDRPGMTTSPFIHLLEGLSHPVAPVKHVVPKLAHHEALQRTPEEPKRQLSIKKPKAKAKAKAGSYLIFPMKFNIILFVQAKTSEEIDEDAENSDDRAFCDDASETGSIRTPEDLVSIL